MRESLKNGDVSRLGLATYVYMSMIGERFF